MCVDLEPEPREALASRLVESLNSEQRAGAVILGAPGLGKSTLAARAISALQPPPHVHRIQGSAILRDTDFGAVALMLGHDGVDGALPMPEAIFRLSRVVADGSTARTGADRDSTSPRPLVVVENAEHLDMSTCFALGQLVQGRSIRLLMLGGLPAHGTIERLEPVLGTRLLDLVLLQPLERGELAALAASLVGCAVSAGTVENLHALSGGIPALAVACLQAAERRGTLVKHRTHAVLGGLDIGTDRALQATVHRMHEAWDEPLGDALLLLALAGPQPPERLRALTGSSEEDLLGTCLVTGRQGVFSLSASIYSEVLRHSVPPGRSRSLRERWADGGLSGWNLHETVWALNTGTAIAPGQRDAAARQANDEGEPLLALCLCTGPFANRRFATAVEELRAMVALGRHLQAQDAAADLAYGATDAVELGRAAACWWGVLLSAGPEPETLAAAAWHVAEAADKLGLADRTAACIEGMRLHSDLLAGQTRSDLAACTDRLVKTGDVDLILGAVHLIVESGMVCPEQASSAATAFTEAYAGGGGVHGPGAEDAVAALVLVLDMVGCEALAEDVLETLVAGPTALRLQRHDQVLLLRGIQLLRHGYLAAGSRKVRAAWSGLQVTGTPGLRLLARHLADGELPGWAAAGPPVSPGLLRRFDELVLAGRAGGSALSALATLYRREGRGLLELEAVLEGLKQDDPDVVGNEAAMGRLADISRDLHGTWGTAVRQLADTWVGGDPSAWATSAAAIEAMGHPGLAQLAWCRSVVSSDASGHGPHRGPALKRLHALRRRLGPDSVALVRRAMSLGDLTPREEEILELAVAGLSNREIARSLTLSQRTVEGHLYRIFLKLGIEERAELIHFT